MKKNKISINIISSFNCKNFSALLKELSESAKESVEEIERLEDKISILNCFNF